MTQRPSPSDSDNTKNILPTRIPDTSPAIPPPASTRGSRKLVWRIFLLLATGLLMTLAFPGYSLWFLGPFCLTPFALCILESPLNRKWLLIYYLFGSLWFTLNLFWLFPVSGGGTIALCFFIGLYWPLFAFGFHRLVVQLRWPAVIALPLVWVSTEYLRATILTGFAWFTLGNTLIPQLALIQIADLFGVWAVSFFCAMTAGFVVDISRLPLYSLRLAGGNAPKKSNRWLPKLALTYIPALLFVLAYGLFRLHQQTTTPGPRIGVVQVSLAQSIKNNPTDEDKHRLLQQHLDFSHQAAADGAQLIAWSETIIPAPINPEVLNVPFEVLTPSGREYFAKAHAINQSLIDFTRTTNTSLLVGVPGWDPTVPLSYNLAILFTPEAGQTSPYYAKRHLVPFGEYIPFGTSIPWLHKLLLKLTPVGFDYTLTPGKQWTRFQLPATPSQNSPNPPLPQSLNSSYSFGVPICYEDVMPYPARSFVDPIDGKKQVDFLLTISNDGWYLSSDELQQHLQLDQMRAVENRVPFARSVNGGNSGFIDSSGRILKLVTVAGKSEFVAGVATATLPLDSRVSLYSRIGDLFPVILCVLSAIAVAWTIVHPRRGTSSGPPVLVETQS